MEKFSEGSRVSPALPSGTPYSSGHSLSGGAIAGIVVGVIALVAVVAGLVALFWLRKRKQRRLADEEHKQKLSHVSEQEADSREIAELTPEDRKPEVDSKKVVELEGRHEEPAELGA